MKSIVRKDGKVLAELETEHSLTVYEALRMAGIDINPLSDADYKAYVESVRIEEIGNQREDDFIALITKKRRPAKKARKPAMSMNEKVRILRKLGIV